jgi:ACS family hexuronate transporter-like MFS transporter
MNSALLLIVIYTGASVGSIVGGWMSGALMSRGWKVGPARLVTMFIPAVLMPLAIMAYYTDSFVLAVLLISMATAGHQWWSANIFTTATDLFPTKVSGAVVGLGAMTGGIGGMFMTLLVALAVQWTGNQQMVFIWAGLMHPISLAIYWFWIGPAFKPASVDEIPDLGRTHPGVLTAGAATMVVGAGLLALIYAWWDVAVRATSVAGAAQAATAAAGVVLIGLALLYAGMARRSTSPAGPA